ncbi:MAG: phospholipase [Candidatus Nanohaloarchaea archaeon]|nr:phospholipase [Candidatus Nanohaloarchaea archaeon]
MASHSDEKVVRRELGDPDTAVILLHGRGATASSIVQLGEAVADDALLLAPQAANREWYPESFLEPRERNQPWLDAALDRVAAMLRQAGEEGLERERCTLVGFSQGACLASEYAARRGDEIELDGYDGDLDGMPFFIGCSDDDPYVPEERVHASASVFEKLGASVTTYIEPGMGHTINQHEQQQLRQHLQAL